MARRIRVEFERGGALLFTPREDRAPETCSCVWESLPLISSCTHGRVPGRSGKQIAIELNLPSKPKREYQSIFADKGDVSYWREWDGDHFQMSYVETLGIHYGVSRSFDMRGYSPFNVFAGIDPNQEEMLAQIGLRVWRKGREKVQLSRSEG